MKISIIIPAFNEERLISETLRQVKAAMSGFSQRDWQTELIVCDNNSTDHTAELAREGADLVVFEPVNQISRARNRGAEAATGDWLLFIDADSHPSAELLAEVADQIARGACLAGGCTVRLDTDSPLGKRAARLWNCLSRTFGLLAGSFIFCEAAAFRTVGGFSRELFVAEELELTMRLKRLARRINKKVVILHQHPLLTSARKLHLYSFREHIWFLTKTVLAGGKTLNSREACHPWYDGRR